MRDYLALKAGLRDPEMASAHDALPLWPAMFDPLLLKRVLTRPMV